MSPYIYNGSQVSDRCPFGYLLSVLKPIFCKNCFFFEQVTHPRTSKKCSRFNQLSVGELSYNGCSSQPYSHRIKSYSSYSCADRYLIGFYFWNADNLITAKMFKMQSRKK